MGNFIAQQRVALSMVQDIIDNGKAAAEADGTFLEASGKIDALGGGTLGIIQQIGVYAACIAVTIFGIVLLCSSSNTRNDHKGSAVVKVIGIFLVVCSVSVVVFIATAAGSIF